MYSDCRDVINPSCVTAVTGGRASKQASWCGCNTWHKRIGEKSLHTSNRQVDDINCKSDAHLHMMWNPS